MEQSIVRLTNHSCKRLRKRFGIKKSATLRFAQDIYANGVNLGLTSKGLINICHNGNSYLFADTIDAATDKKVILLVTALNENKGSEWTDYVNGDRKKFATTKRALLNNGVVQKTKSAAGRQPKHRNNIYLGYEDCA